MTIEQIETKRAPTVPDEEGWFSALVYRTNAPPDADGDVIADGAIEDGTPVVVSASGHDVLTDGAEPAGEAALYHGKAGVVAIGRTFATELGRALRRRLREANVEWSVGFRVLSSRRPTREERGRYPSTRRIILKWAVTEISPVTAGSCGPACATLASKAATCGGPCCGTDVREDALRELARFERTRFLLFTQKQQTDRDLEILEWHELRASEVSAELRAAAVEGVELAVEILGGTAPRIRWYDTAARDELGANGITYRGEGAIWLAAREDDEPGVYRTALHETFHALRPAAGEADAAYFGNALLIVRGRNVRVGSLSDYEGHLVSPIPGLWAPPSQRVRHGAADLGTLVIERNVLFERGEDGWREITRLA